jgi:hypothetical protein
VFTVAVETYSVGSKTELPMHFSNCARAEIKRWLRQEKKKQKATVSIEEEVIDVDTIPDLIVNPFYAIEGYISLKDFRKFLPDPYRIILDDAVYSFDNTRKFRQTKPINCPLSSHRYYEAKRIFQLVAEFFLRG